LLFTNYLQPCKNQKSANIADFRGEPLQVGLNTKSHFYECPFTFNGNQPNRKNQNNVDIGVYTFNSKLFFTIECKRLPTPRNSKRDEMEYVFGKLGGIERFKRNLHGIDKEGNLFVVNAMIGYIEKENFEYWFDKINFWLDEKANSKVEDLSWTTEEKLKKLDFDKIATSYSVHNRIDSTKVELNHFWIYLK
jgi:hypothetical protein